MKHNNIIGIVLFIGMVVLFSGLPHANVVGKIIKVSSQRRFDKAVAKYRYAVVLFYQRDKQTRRDERMRGQISDLETMTTSLSKSPRYKEAKLPFLRVNVAKADLDQLAQKYGVTQMPTFMLFSGGEEVREGRNIARLTGFVSRTQLEAFIDKHLKDQIEDTIEQKAEARKRRLERARIRAYYYPYGYGGYYGWPYHYGYGWPYYGYGFGYGRYW